MPKWLANVLGAGILVTGYALSGSTADGTPVQRGVAACPESMPFGTVLSIEGVGQVACHDRTPGSPWLVDVWFPTIAECYAVTGWRSYEVVG